MPKNISKSVTFSKNTKPSKYQEESSEEEEEEKEEFEFEESEDDSNEEIDTENDEEDEDDDNENDDMDDEEEEDGEEVSENEDQDSNQDQEDDEEEAIDRKVSKEDGFRDAIRSELNSMTFEQIQQLQNKLGLKKFKEVMQDKSEQKEASGAKVFTRLNKNRPQELTSKKPVPVFRNIFQVKKKEFIDPRFNPALGEYKPEVFRKRYGFINDMRKNEKEMLTQELKKEEDPVRKDQLKAALTRLKQQIHSFKEGEKKEDFKNKLRKMANEDAKQGKKPHFVNKSEQKILELAEKYKELKKSGKIEKFLAKKRKKQLGKDKKSFGNPTKHLRFV